MRPIKKWRTFASLFTLATVIYAIKTRQSHGRFLKVPFEFRLPTVQRVRERWWNPEEGRIFGPHAFGVGWSVNLHEVARRLCLVKEQPAQEEEAVEQAEDSSPEER